MGKEPSGLSLTPERCQDHAKAARDMARAESDQGKRKQLDDIAAAWEDLCEELRGRAIAI
jgi:hypothetical protein